MPWEKVLMTVLIAALWVFAYSTRHFFTRKSVQLYGFKWSQDFQRKYADVGIWVMLPFYLFLIWFLWKVVPD